MKKIGKRMMAGFLTAAVTVGLFGVTGFGRTSDIAEAAEIPVRETTTASAGKNTVLLGVEGVDTTSSLKDIVDEINAVRKDACESGNVPDPRNKKRMLSEEDYVEIKIGANLQKAAVVRAAEGAVFLDHDRPNGTSCFTAQSYFGVSGAENLAWHYKVGTAMDGWIGEKNDWVNQNAGKVTGHYTSMINPNYRYVGIATFNPSNDTVNYDWACTSGEFASTDTALTDLENEQNQTVIQKMEVSVDKVTAMNIVGDAVINEGTTGQATLKVDFTFTVDDGSASLNTTRDCPVYDGVAWTVDDDKVLAIAEDGTMTAKKAGQVTVTATIGEGSLKQSVDRTVVVVPEGVTVTDVENPDMVTTDYGTAPILSKTVKANLSDGSYVYVDASWDSYSASELNSTFLSKEFEITGNALGFDLVQKVHVNAVEILMVYTGTEELTTDSGVMPSSVTVNVYSSDRVTHMYPAPWNATWYVVWDKDTLNHYKDRLGGDFEVKGYVKITTDNGEEHFGVVQKMHVNPATVTDVEFTETEVTTDSGTVPDYPKASVTWSNGDKTEEDIEWEDADPTETDRKYMAREGGDYTLTGTYNGESTTITVHVNPATPTTATIPVAEQNKTVPSGTAAVLTKTASIAWSNGDVTSATIAWDAQSHDDYGKIDGGSYTVKGTAEGLEVSVLVTVLPATIKSVEELTEIQTVQKKAPILPETVHVVWSNEDETDEAVAWEAIPASAYAEPNEDFVVKGTITDFDGKETTVTVSVHVNERELQKIEWKSGKPESDTSYYTYMKEDLTGTLIATYDNGETEEVELTTDMITSFDATSLKSTQTVTVTYTVAGISRTLDVTMHLIQRDGISITKLPTKLAYIEAQELDVTGIEITESLDDGTSRVLPEEEFKKVVFTGYTMNPKVYGKQTISATIGAFTDTFEVTVRERQLSSIDIWSLPKQLTYVEGQPLNMTGLGVKAIYDNGQEKELSVTSDMLRMNLTEEKLAAGDFGDPANTDTIGMQNIYVLYSERFTDGEQTGTHYAAAYVTIDVLEKVVQSIEFVKVPAKTEYPEDDVTFDNFSDAVLLVHNNNDYDEEVSITEAKIEGFDISKVDSYEVTVTYGGKSLTFDATVRAKKVEKTYVVPPTRVSYTEEEFLDLTGGEIVIEYDNGREDRISLADRPEGLTITFDDESDPTKALTEGKRELIVTWKGEKLLTEDGKTIEIDTIHKVLQKIEWKAGSPTSDTSYYTYKKEDLTGTLLASYDNGDVEEVAVTPAMITTFDPDSQKSTQTVTITYSYAGVSVTMDTVMKLVKRTGIQVTKTPARVEYIEGEAFEAAGIEISELLDNNEVRPLSDEELATAIYTGYTMRPTTYGDQTITVRVGDFSDTFMVNVRKKQLAGMQLLSAPTLLTYVETQPLSLEGLKVQAVYDNGDTADVAVTPDMLREGVSIEGLQTGSTGTAAEAKGVGTHTISVLYSEKLASGGTLFAWVDYEIEVIEKVVQSIEFVTEPSKTEYPEGDVNYDQFGGIRIVAHCNNDYDEIIEVSEDLISGFDLDMVGDQTVTITYGGQTITFPAKVREKVATRTVVTAPTKTDYEPGEKLDLTGAMIIITYDNGTVEKIPVTEENADIQVSFVGGSDTEGTLSEGSKKLVITYKGEALEMADGKPVTIKVEEKKVKTKYKNEWRKGVWYDKNGYATKYTMTWKKIGSNWTIVDNTGWKPKNKWQKIDGKWYYFKANTYMASKEWIHGWWINKNGTCTYPGKASWHHNSKGWWYEDNRGWYAHKSWQKIDNKWYYFNAAGYMVTNCYVGGYWIGADGVCRE